MPADVALRIDKEDVHYSAFEAYLRANVDAKAVDLNGKTLSSLLDQFLDEKLLHKLAIARGLMPSGGDERLAVSLLLEHFDPQLDQAELEKYYFEHLDDFRRPDRVRLRQILVYDRPTADKALAALKKGESFADVAARFSQDPKAQAGGDQGVLEPRRPAAELRRNHLPPRRRRNQRHRAGRIRLPDLQGRRGAAGHGAALRQRPPGDRAAAPDRPGRPGAGPA